MTLDLGEAIKDVFGSECTMDRAMSARYDIKEQLDIYIGNVERFFKETPNIESKYKLEIKVNADGSNQAPFIKLKTSDIGEKYPRLDTTTNIVFSSIKDAITINKITNTTYSNDFPADKNDSSSVTYEELRGCLSIAIEQSIKVMTPNDRALLGEYLQKEYADISEPAESPKVL